MSETYDREGFFEVMQRPDAPDEMTLVLRRPDDADDDHAFSQEGFESLGYQFHDFVLARTLGHWKHGAAPRGLEVEVKLRWDEPPTNDELQQGDNPWYAYDDGRHDDPTFVTAEGEARLRAFLARRWSKEGGEA